MKLTTDPILKRSITISSSVTFGVGKKEFFYSLVKDAIGKHCIYCGDMLLLDTMSLDHKIPYGQTKLRTNKLITKTLNVASNFQIICRKCNTMKGNLSHEKFAKFMTFLNSDYEIKDYIYRKMTQASLMYGISKRKNAY